VNRRALLDVNVLVALFDPDHVHHDLAHDWFVDHRSDGWASCPLTQNGLIRVLANPRYGSPNASLRGVRETVRRFLRSNEHEFWPDDVSIADDTLFNVAAVTGHRQITDIYLLGLATRHGGHLVTFDRSIPVKAIIGAGRESLTLIEAVDQT
jgi:uncharacterized protein